MIHDDTKRNIRIVILMIMNTGQLRYTAGDVSYRIHIEQGSNILADTGKTLQPHTGIDVLLRQIGIVSFAVVIKLGKDIIPDFDIAVTVTSHGAVRFAASMLWAAVIIDFTAGTARSGTMLPEIVFFAETENAVCFNTDLVMPDVPCLIIVKIDRGIQPVRLKAHPLWAGEKLPGPGNGFGFKIISK